MKPADAILAYLKEQSAPVSRAAISAATGIRLNHMAKPMQALLDANKVREVPRNPPIRNYAPLVEVVPEESKRDSDAPAPVVLLPPSLRHFRGVRHPPMPQPGVRDPERYSKGYWETITGGPKQAHRRAS